jgi:6-phosphogluconolactonase
MGDARERRIVVADAVAVPRRVALEAAKVLAEAIRERGWASLALPGGPHARAALEVLAELQLEWDKVEFYFVEERCVPPVHPASNYGQAADVLLDNPRIGEHQFHRIQGELGSHARAAEIHAAELPGRLDLVLLELAGDGHVGAFFPGAEALRAKSGEDVLVLEVAAKPRYRIALAPSRLTGARERVVWAVGPECAGAVRAVFGQAWDPVAWPGQHVRDGLWILDRAAARGLEP